METSDSAAMRLVVRSSSETFSRRREAASRIRWTVSWLRPWSGTRRAVPCGGAATKVCEAPGSGCSLVGKLTASSGLTIAQRNGKSERELVFVILGLGRFAPPGKANLFRYSGFQKTYGCSRFSDVDRRQLCAQTALEWTKEIPAGADAGAT